jgi:DNA invertase Pin-like site-specific DNA recombinase
MSKVGYARVSTRGQSDDSQVDELTAYGCDRIFIDHGVSGKHASRPELDKALEYMRSGDVFVITRMSRAMRSLRHMIELAEQLRERGIDLVVIKQAIDTTTPHGRLVFHLLASIDEFQRELIIEGTREGLEAARVRGRIGGARPKLSPAKAKEVKKMFAEDRPPREIMELFGISRATLYRYVGTEAERAAEAARPR